MSESVKPRCGNCSFFTIINGDARRGACYFNPPVIFNTGEQKRPMVFPVEMPCGQHKPLPEGEKPATKEKVRPSR